MPRSWLRVAAWVAAGASVVAAVVAVRVLTESHDELSEADRLRAAGEIDASIPHYRRALAWHAPANPFAGDALSRLLAIARAAHAEGDEERALAAFRAVRAGIMNARSVYTPHASTLADVDAQIADALARSAEAEAEAEADPGPRSARHLQALREDPRPNPALSALVLVGFAGWVVSAVGFAMRAFDEEDRLHSGRARRWATGFVVAFGLFVLGLLLA